MDRLGVPFNSTYNLQQENPQKVGYYAQASGSIELLRNLSAPSPTPIDRLRLELDEQFEFGAQVARFEGLPTLAGIARITHSELSHLSAKQPHFDALPPSYSHLDAQLAANVYLKVPESGGELEIWDVPPVDPLFEPPKDWRSELPPSVNISPQEGDLIIFSCRKPHAIGKFEGEPRVSVQVFMGYQKGKPLQLWN